MAETTGATVGGSAQQAATLVHAVPGAAWLLLLLCLSFGVLAPDFCGLANLRNVLLQATILLLLALPMTLIILTEGLDLSMGASLSLCTVVLATVQIGTGSVGLGLLAAMLTGVLDNVPGAARDIVILNAGAALYAADVSVSLQAGIVAARAALDSGAARARLEQLRAVSKKLTT